MQAFLDEVIKHYELTWFPDGNMAYKYGEKMKGFDYNRKEIKQGLLPMSIRKIPLQKLEHVIKQLWNFDPKIEKDHVDFMVPYASTFYAQLTSMGIFENYRPYFEVFDDGTYKDFD